MTHCRGSHPGTRKLDASLLSLLAPFAELTTTQQCEIVDQARAYRLGQGEHVFDEGMPADHFFLLLDGYVRVLRATENGDHVIMLHIPSGELIGIATAFGWGSYPATAIAASECVILAWPAKLWHEFVKRYPGFAAETMKMLGPRVGEFNNRVVEMATLQVERRIAHMILRLIKQTGRKTTEGIEIGLPVSRLDLAEMTGTTLHTVSRLLSNWQKKGWVRSGRRRIIVTDPHQLVLLSEGHD